MSGTAWAVIGAVPWIVLAAISLPAVVNGRELLFGLPTGWRPGRQLRLFAAITLAVCAFMVYQDLTAGIFRDGIFVSYVAMAWYAVWAGLQLRRTSG